MSNFQVSVYGEKTITLNSPSSNGRSVQCYNNGNGLDVTIVVDGREVKASKYMLMLVSPVFELMFEDGKWQESVDNKIEIEDFEFDTVETFVKMIHGFPINLNNFEKTIKLLMISQKYQVDAIQQQISQVFQHFGVNKDVILETLRIGHKFGVQDIKSQERAKPKIETPEKCDIKPKEPENSNFFDHIWMNLSIILMLCAFIYFYPMAAIPLIACLYLKFK